MNIADRLGYKMRTKAAAIGMAALLLITGPCIAAIYSVGVVPQFSARAIQQIWTPILNDLQRRTGHTFTLRGSPSISAFEQQLLAGEFDFAYMNPYHFIKASKAHGYLPLVRDTAKKLRGILVVRKDSPLVDLSQLQGTTIAFPSPNALGASLMMRAILAQDFKLDFEPKYVKSHDSVYLNVAVGSVEAGGGVGRTLAQQPPEVRDQLRVLYTTPAVASHPLAAHPRVPEPVRKKVQAALIAMAEIEAGRQLLAKIPITTVGPALAEDYVSLQAMGLEAFYVDK